jgi:hypothetical protein
LSGPGYTACFANPNTLQSQSMAAFASRYLSVGMMVERVAFVMVFLLGEINSLTPRG